MKLYRAYVSEAPISRDGLDYWIQEGEAVDVYGREMVSLPHAIVPAGDFQMSRAAAIQTAADRIEEVGCRLLAQAEVMRRDASEGGA